MSEHVSASKGTVLYDGGCGFCSRWVHFWEPTLRRHGFRVAALQEPWVEKRLGADPAQLLADIRLLTPDGNLVSGANVYLHVARRIWWMTPFLGHLQSAGIQSGTSSLLSVGRA